MLDLDGAIKHAEEKAEELKQKAGFETDNLRYMMSDSERLDCLECAKEHEQLAEWLKELKAYREATKKLNETAEYYKDSLFGDGIRFCRKVMNEVIKREQV